MADTTKSHSMLCIICPEGCEMEISEKDGELSFPEGICRRGQEYARQEIADPARVLTTTVRLLGSDIAMIPVRSARPIPKEKLIEAMDQIAGISIEAPVTVGQELAADLAGTGVPLIASRDVLRAANISRLSYSSYNNG